MLWTIYQCTIMGDLDLWGRPTYWRGNDPVGQAYAKTSRKAIQNAIEDKLLPSGSCTYREDHRYISGEEAGPVVGVWALYKNRSRNHQKWILFYLSCDPAHGSFGGTLPL